MSITRPFACFLKSSELLTPDIGRWMPSIFLHRQLPTGSIESLQLRPLLIIGKIHVVNPGGVVHDSGESTDNLLGIWTTNIVQHRISCRENIRRKGQHDTYAEHTNTDTMNPKSVASASVGWLPPKIQNGPSSPSLSALILDTLSLSFRVCQISLLNCASSSLLNRPVP